MTVAYQGPPPVGFFRLEYWSGLPFPTPGDLPKPGIKPMVPVSPALQADSLPLSHQETLVWILSYFKKCMLVTISYRVQISFLFFFAWKIIALISCSFGEGKGTPLQYSCLGNPMDRGAWWVIVYEVAKSRIQLSIWTAAVAH